MSSGTTPVAPPVTSGPATFTLTIPAAAANGSTVTVRARARDSGGNLSDEGTILLTVGDAAAPVATILAPAVGTQSAPGQTITFTVRATDDTAVQRIVFTASGVFAASETRQLVPPVASLDSSFAVVLPPGTAAGALTLSAEAFDAAGNSSGVVTRAVTVTDAVAPAVRIVSPLAGAQIDPRTPLTVTIEATDAVGVSQISLAATGVDVRVREPSRRAARDDAHRDVHGRVWNDAPDRRHVESQRERSRRCGQHRDRDWRNRPGSRCRRSGDRLGRARERRDRCRPVDRGDARLLRAHEPRHTDAGGGAIDRRRDVRARVDLDRDRRPLRDADAQPRRWQSTRSSPLPSTAVSATPAGNALGTTFTSTFRTASPDGTAPQVESIDPPDNATGVGTTTPVSVTFTEPIDPASVSATSFRVLTGGTPLAGSFTFLNGNRVARFTPAAPWPFEAVIVTELTGAILDAAGNALVTSAGQPITSPLTFTFLTGNFAITSPAGTEVVERTHITLTAQASAALNVTSVVFSVNGAALPAITSAPFSTGFNVPARSTASSLTIVASARNAQNAEIARAEKVVAVTGGLSASPTVLGVPRGATRSVRFSIAEPAESDLAIALSVVDPSVFAVRRDRGHTARGSDARRRARDRVHDLSVGSGTGRQGRRQQRARGELHAWTRGRDHFCERSDPRSGADADLHDDWSSCLASSDGRTFLHRAGTHVSGHGAHPVAAARRRHAACGHGDQQQPGSGDRDGDRHPAG